MEEKMTDKIHDKIHDEKSHVTVGTSRKINLRRLLHGRPEVEQAALSARAAIALGDLVRELRTGAGVSQHELAERVGSTQAHISELERGLGRNGPTVGIIARIIHELNDEIVIDTKKRREQRETDLIAAAQASVTQVAERLSREHSTEGLPHVLYAFSALRDRENNALRDREYNPFMRVLADGLLTGIYMALKVVPGYPKRIQSEWSRIEEVVFDERPHTPAYDSRRIAELVCSYSHRR